MSGIVSLFPYDIASIVAMLPDLEHAWTEEIWRQAMPYTPHRDSETIFIRRQPGSRPRDVLHQLASVATRHTVSRAAHTVRFPARAMLVRLKPGGRIEQHTDTGIYAEATIRFHLPIITNPGVWLEVDGTRYQLEAGTVFAFDKHVPHSGGNDGDEARIHMIVDAYPDSPGVFAG